MLLTGISSSVVGGIGAAKASGSSERIAREQIAAAEREGKRARENYNRNWFHYLQVFRSQVDADVRRRQPFVDAIHREGPMLSNMLYGDGSSAGLQAMPAAGAVPGVAEWPDEPPTLQGEAVPRTAVPRVPPNDAVSGQPEAKPVQQVVSNPDGSQTIIYEDGSTAHIPAGGADPYHGLN